MSVNVSHTDFTDATTLFADLAAANAMLDGLTVPDATTSTDGVVKKAAASADIASIGGTSISSASAVTAITFSTSDASNPTKAEIIVTLNQMAQQINHLKSVLRSAGILT
tara:strand:+ start:236 stop:565 length:330 start_codon:yes stop_codon:yes gene_type:complete